MTKLSLLLVILVAMSCAGQEKVILYQDIDYPNLSGLLPVSTDKGEYPYFEIIEKNANEKTLIIWDSKDKASRRSFTKVNDCWVFVKDETIDEDLVSHQVIIIKGSTETTYGCSKMEGSVFLHSLSISDGNNSVDYFFDKLELGLIKESQYPDSTEILRKVVIRSMLRHRYIAKDNLVKSESDYQHSDLKYSRKYVDCFALKGKRFTSKSWKPFYLLNRVDCDDE